MSGRGVTKFVTGVTLKVRWGGLLVRGAGIERKPLQENDSPGGRRRRRRPARGTCRGNQSPGPGFTGCGTRLAAKPCLVGVGGWDHFWRVPT